MSKVTQVIPNDLVVRALKHYRQHLLDLKAEIGQDEFYESIESYGEDEYDLCSEIVLYEKSKIELTFDKEVYENFSQHSIDGVDYPMFNDAEYPLYEVVEKSQVVKSKKLITDHL